MREALLKSPNYFKIVDLDKNNEGDLSQPLVLLFISYKL